jgi:hypothetical protein
MGTHNPPPIFHYPRQVGGFRSNALTNWVKAKSQKMAL